MSRYTYRFVENGSELIVLRDDGYRIQFHYIGDESGDESAPAWEMWAEYKQCDLPRVGRVIAALLMKETPSE